MPKYEIDDLAVRHGERNINGEITTHSHVVVFARSLTEGEKLLFTRMIQGFYYAVRFSRQFGDNLIAEPVVEFIQPDQVRYTLRQHGMSGPWKDLLFAMLANFSREIVGIQQHDGGRVFGPAHWPAAVSVQTETAPRWPAAAIRESSPDYETETLVEPVCLVKESSKRVGVVPSWRDYQEFCAAHPRDPELLTGLNGAELQLLANGMLVPHLQERLNHLLQLNREGKLNTEEERELDQLLEQVDQMNVLKARAAYTLRQREIH
ncbi:MAG: hypothetical protein U9R15_09895 [Chloroflexota bacterium]|nr:hypothetical protein [Chloroflexota bacterium]